MNGERNALSALKNAQSGDTVTLNQGEYHVSLSDTVSRVYYPSNNDAGEKKIAFFFENMHDLVLDGNGSKLVFHGRISPFLFDKCTNVTLKNFVIDYDRPFFTQGEIISCDDKHFDLKIDREKYPYRIQNGGIIFYSDDWEADTSRGINLFLPFDSGTRAPAYNSILAIAVTGERAQKDENSPIPEEIFQVSELPGGTVRFEGNCRLNCKAGQIMVITHERRDNNIISAFDCEEITFENVNIVHGGAMGILCQTCTNVTLRGIRCGTETERLVSLNCDATHFVNCDGKLLIEDCDFFNMMDDAVNVHSIYMRVKSAQEGRLLLELKHFQQFRVNVFRTGDEADIYKCKNMKPCKKVRVLAARFLSESLLELQTDSDLSDIEEGDLAQNSERMPEVTIRGCKAGRNRPRGFLVSSPKRVVVEDNEFETSSFALFFTCDTAFWYEGTFVRDILIRGNLFKNCGYHYGEASIAFWPMLSGEAQSDYFNRNIVIENNRFETFTGGALYCRDTEDLIFRKNEIVVTQAYPWRRRNAPVECEHCRNIVIE